MPLRTTLLTTGEIIRDFQLSPEARIQESLELIAANRPDTAGYLLGYAAEMLLKNACFLFNGAATSDTIQSHRQLSVIYYENLYGKNKKHWPIDPEAWHSAKFWHGYLINLRADAKQPLATPLSKALAQCVDRLYDGWDVSMRYRPPPLLTFNEVMDLLDDVTWLQKKHPELYRRI